MQKKNLWQVLVTLQQYSIQSFFHFHPQSHLVLQSKKYNDERGSFSESFVSKSFIEHVKKDIVFCQDNFTYSKKNVIRGLHYQLPPYAQSKLISVLEGKVLDVVVDIRKGSPTYGDYFSLELSSENLLQLFVPRGFAHGFLTLSDDAEVQYKTDNFWDKDCERSLVWNDKNLNINWPKNSKFKAPTLSKKDLEAPSFIDAKSKGEIFK